MDNNIDVSKLPEGMLVGRDGTFIVEDLPEGVQAVQIRRPTTLDYFLDGHTVVMSEKQAEREGSVPVAILVKPEPGYEFALMAEFSHDGRGVFRVRRVLSEPEQIVIIMRAVNQDELNAANHIAAIATASAECGYVNASVIRSR